MKTADFSNIVMLLDGIKNNHPCELSFANSKRTKAARKADKRFVFDLKESPAFINGKYVYEEETPDNLWLAAVAFGNFNDGVNGDTIENVFVTILFLSKKMDRESVSTAVRYYFQKRDPQTECVVVALFNQDDLFRKTRIHKKSSLLEVICFQADRTLQQITSFLKSKSSS